MFYEELVAIHARPRFCFTFPHPGASLSQACRSSCRAFPPRLDQDLDRDKEEKNMKLRIPKVLCLPLFLAALGGCAGMTETRNPIENPQQRAMAARTETAENARISLQAAKGAGCEVAAPFEYSMAKEYLLLAEQELAGGDKDGVVEFAEKSKACSTKAIEMAKGGDQTMRKAVVLPTGELSPGAGCASMPAKAVVPSSRTGMIASKIAEAEDLGAQKDSPQALAKAKVALVHVVHEEQEGYHHPAWLEKDLVDAEKTVDALLAERKSAASRDPRLHRDPDVLTDPGESGSRQGK